MEERHTAWRFKREVSEEESANFDVPPTLCSFHALDNSKPSAPSAPAPEPFVVPL